MCQRVEWSRSLRPRCEPCQHSPDGASQRSGDRGAARRPARMGARPATAIRSSLQVRTTSSARCNFVAEHGRAGRGDGPPPRPGDLLGHGHGDHLHPLRGRPDRGRLRAGAKIDASSDGPWPIAERAENRRRGSRSRWRGRAAGEPLLRARWPARERDRLAGGSGLRRRGLGGARRGAADTTGGAPGAGGDRGGPGRPRPGPQPRAGAAAPGREDRRRAWRCRAAAARPGRLARRESGASRRSAAPGSASGPGASRREED